MYLLVGASIFLYIERPYEMESCDMSRIALSNKLNDFGDSYFYSLGPVNESVTDIANKEPLKHP